MKERITKDTFTRAEIERLAVVADLRSSHTELALMSLDKSYSEMAEAKNWPINTVKSRLNRIRRKLADAAAIAPAA